MTAKISLHAETESNVQLESDLVEFSNEEVIETGDYNLLKNKPSIDGNELIGDKSLEQLGITKDSLDITAESLGITPEAMGMDTADTYSIYSLFHS